MRKTIATLLVILISTALSAAEWTDVTNLYMQNADYSKGTTGWIVNASANSNTSYNAHEFWNGTGTMMQTVQLPNGHYRLSVNGYYRPGGFDTSLAINPDNALRTAMLVAGEEQTPLASVYSEWLNQNYSSCNRLGNQYYPNNMEAAHYCFQKGMYQNQIEVDVTDGTLTLGISNLERQNENWAIWGNWKLEVWGETTKVSEIQLSLPNGTNLTRGQKVSIQTTILPNDALIKILAWSSSNSKCVSVDQQGNITALAAGTATITAQAQDGSNVEGSITVKVSTNLVGLSSLIFTEIQSANIDQDISPSWNFDSWVEIHNPTDKAITLTGCWLSDDALNLKKIEITQPLAIEAHGYERLWLTILDMDGGQLFLSRSSGSKLLSMDYPPATPRCSWALKSTEGNEWGWTDMPTPGKSNEQSAFHTLRLEAPIIDQPSQIYGSNLTVCVNIPQGTTLRYTTDGSAPTATNGETSEDGLFYPNGKTTTYRFCLVAEGYLPSPVITRTYIYKDRDFALPVFSVVSDERNLWGEDYGIFTKGNGNGRPGNGQDAACNWNMDWNRPANFEWLDTEGRMQVNQETNLERCGGWSRAWTPYSFKVKANKKFEGQNYLPYAFFTTKPYLRHKTLQIRNGGNDTGCRIKDPAIGEIIRSSGLDVDLQAYQPAQHYLNGRYAGVLNVREPNNKHYVLANYGLDEDEIDQFEMSPDSGYVQKCGTYESMQQWKDLSEQCATSTDAYDQICQLVDIDEYTNYMALMLYLGTTDWPQNNIKGFKPIGGKFRFVVFDTDSAMENDNDSPFSRFAWKQNYTFDQLRGEGLWNTQITKEIEMVTIFLNMIENETFRKRFVDTYCLISGSVFQPERCQQIINQLASAVAASQEGNNEVYGWSQSPWGTANSLISKFSSNRQAQMMNHMRNYNGMQLGNATSVELQLSANIPQARLIMNELSVPTNTFNGQLFLPITLRAEAPVGYKFVGWDDCTPANTGTMNFIEKGSVWDYYDQGSLDGTQWYANDYNASQWNSGNAPIGYGKEQPTITQSGRPTYYFRKQIDLDKELQSDVTLDFVADDGFIIYVNGKEAARYNMPSGAVTYNTFATTYAPGNPDTGTLTLNSSLFRMGNNVVAVEVHNNNATSTDIVWDASISAEVTYGEHEIISNEPELEVTEELSGHVLQACFVPMSDEEKHEQGINTAPIVINEVSAGNSVNANEYWKKDDWVELYNTTDQDIDLEGMYLTDHISQPQRWQITGKDTKASTIIPAHGYKIIWCSGRKTNTELHAPFKLNNKEVSKAMLSAADGSWSDTLYYQPHEGTQSVGRYPDGASSIYVMDRTTIAASNRINSYAQVQTYDPASDPATGVQHLHARENGSSIIFAHGELIVKMEETDYTELYIYNLSGALVERSTLTLIAGTNRYSTAHLQPGTYVAKTGEVGVKFIVHP